MMNKTSKNHGDQMYVGKPDPNWVPIPFVPKPRGNGTAGNSTVTVPAGNSTVPAGNSTDPIAPAGNNTETGATAPVSATTPAPTNSTR